MSSVVHVNKPQGFTRMDNNLYEALIGADLSGRELRVALAIHRLTAGYQVDVARIAASVIADMTSIHREDVSRAICELIRQRVIYRTRGSRSPIGFAPVSEWSIDQKNTHPHKPKAVPQRGVSTTSNVALVPHYKESKENLVPSELVAAAPPTSAEQVAEAHATNAPPDRPPQTHSERIPFQKIVDLYNRVCGKHLPQCLKLNEKRKRNIRKCWNLELDGDFPFRSLECWEGYFYDCLQNPHWIGYNDRGWRADLEFVTREDKVLKVLEGA
ncbi:replication protein [Pseudomonas schmalbachii]|uniref:Replication protein n=1 Tax=Pseudomonas schmalbachii TaxID=2816993 RepID=A0ABS3TKB7_9PSED|nr:replication protein [Pseudomonas schmalbachii]MBO3274096.1 replication protein [Pseudomonas schmalbachii]